MERHLFGDALRYLGYDPTEKEVNEYFNLILPKTKPERINFEEFMKVKPMLRVPFTEEEVKIAFDYLDKDKDGQISMKEFKDKLCTEGDQFTQEEANEIFQELDMNGDGQI